MTRVRQQRHQKQEETISLKQRRRQVTTSTNGKAKVRIIPSAAFSESNQTGTNASADSGASLQPTSGVKHEGMEANSGRISRTSTQFAENQKSKAPEKTPVTHTDSVDNDDQELLKRVFKARNGEKLKRLMEGDFIGYKSSVDADSARICKVIFWVGEHLERVEQIMRNCASPLKDWDEQIDGKTRLQLRIQKCYDFLKKKGGGKLNCYRWPRQKEPDSNESDARNQKEADSSESEAGSRMLKKSEAERYGIKNGGFFYDSNDVKEAEVSLTNFTAKILRDIVHDDGAVQHRLIELEATIGPDRKIVSVPAEDFQRMTWIGTQLGSKAIMFPGRFSRERTRAAIQATSGQVPEHLVFRHTGWREVGGQLAFLHGNGAIGADAHQTNLRLDGLDRYQLPVGGCNILEGIRASLRFLNLSSSPLGYVLFAVNYRAPLCHFLPCSVLVHVEGPSGSFKSSFCAAGLAHFGKFASKEDLPARWAFTGTILEKLTFLAKDVPLVIDDLNPEHNFRLRQALEENFSRIIGAVGDQTGKKRSNEKLETRPEFYPRGVVLSTGEYTPQLATSRQGRLLVGPVARNDIKKAELTALQELLPVLPGAMIGYLNHIRSVRLRRARSSG